MKRFYQIGLPVLLVLFAPLVISCRQDLNAPDQSSNLKSYYPVLEIKTGMRWRYETNYSSGESVSCSRGCQGPNMSQSDTLDYTVISGDSVSLSINSDTTHQESIEHWDRGRTNLDPNEKFGYYMKFPSCNGYAAAEYNTFQVALDTQMIRVRYDDFPCILGARTKVDYYVPGIGLVYSVNGNDRYPNWWISTLRLFEFGGRAVNFLPFIDSISSR